MGYKLGYHILVLPNQVLLINSVLTNEVLLYVQMWRSPPNNLIPDKTMNYVIITAE